MEPRLTEHAKQAIANSRDEAIRLKNGAIGAEHLFLGILREEESSTVKMLRQMEVDIQAVKSRIEGIVGQLDSDIRYSMDSEIPMLRQTEKILRLSFLESTRLKSKEIHTIHMLLAMLQEGENTVSQVLQQFGVDHKKCIEYLQRIGDLPSSVSPSDFAAPLPDFRSQTSEDDNDDPYADPDDDNLRRPGGAFNTGSAPKSENKTPALENFGRDLTRMAREGKLDPIVGRERELERIAQILSRRKKSASRRFSPAARRTTPFLSVNPAWARAPLQKVSPSASWKAVCLAPSTTSASSRSTLPRWWQAPNTAASSKNV